MLPIKKPPPTVKLAKEKIIIIIPPEISLLGLRDKNAPKAIIKLKIALIIAK